MTITLRSNNDNPNGHSGGYCADRPFRFQHGSQHRSLWLLKSRSPNYGVTVKDVALVAVPPGAVTPIFPVFAPVGTVAVIWLLFFTVNVLAFPPNVTPLASVNPLSVIVTAVPTLPLVGLKPRIVGRHHTRNVRLLLSVPPGVVTFTNPVVAPEGTVAVR